MTSLSWPDYYVPPAGGRSLFVVCVCTCTCVCVSWVRVGIFLFVVRGVSVVVWVFAAVAG